jgi:nicotinamidase-related amidase
MWRYARAVEGTGRHATELGYSVTLVKDATAAFTMDLQHAATELTGPLYSDAVISTDELLIRLSPPASVPA